MGHSLFSLVIMPLSDKIAKIYLGRKSSKASARNSAKSTSKPTQRKNRAPEQPLEVEESIETQNIGLEESTDFLTEDSRKMSEISLNSDAQTPRTPMSSKTQQSI